MRTDRQTYGQTDGQTYMTKPIVAFRNFANAPKMCGAIPPLQHIYLHGLHRDNYTLNFT
jgi:hypothetical protein